MDDSRNKSDMPLMGLVKAWRLVLQSAQKFKKAKFQEDADEAMKFFHGGHELNNMLWNSKEAGGDRGHLGPDEEGGELPKPSFRMQINKVSELVQLFGPSMYHRNPTIVVEPKTLDIPIDLLIALVPPDVMQQNQQQYMMQAQQQQQQQMATMPPPQPGQPPPQPPPIPPFNPASLFPPDPKKNENVVISKLLNYYLDYIQRENDKKTHARRMVDEALIKGMGVLWTEQFEAFPGAAPQVGSFYDSVDNLLIDPDAETIQDAKWIARRCIHPYWQVEQEYGWKPGSLEKKASKSTVTQDSATEADDHAKYWKRTGKSNDLIVYWKIWSKMGLGDKLSKPNADGPTLIDKQYLPIIQGFGDFTYMVIVDDVPEFLNLKNEDLLEAVTAPAPEEIPGQEQADPHENLFQAVQWPIPFWSFGEWPFTYLAFHEVPNCLWPMSHIKPGMGQLKFINYCFSFLAAKIRHSCRTLMSVVKSAGDELKRQIMSGEDYTVVEISELMGKNLNEVISYLQPPPFQQDIYHVLAEVMESFDKATGLSELMYAASGGMRSAQEAQVKQGSMNVRPDDMASKVEDAMSLCARKEAMALRWMDNLDIAAVLGDRGAALWQHFVMSKEPEKIGREFNFRVEAGSARKPNKDTRVSQAQNLMQVLAPFFENYTMKTGNPAPFNAMLGEYLEAMDVEPKPEFFLSAPPPAPPPPNKAAELQMQMQIAQQKGQQDLAAGQQKMQLDGQRMQMDAAQKQQEIQMQQAQTVMEMREQQQQHKFKLDELAAQLHTKQQVHKITVQKAKDQAKAKQPS